MQDNNIKAAGSLPGSPTGSFSECPTEPLLGSPAGSLPGFTNKSLPETPARSPESKSDFVQCQNCSQSVLASMLLVHQVL